MPNVGATTRSTDQDNNAREVASRQGRNNSVQDAARQVRTPQVNVGSSNAAAPSQQTTSRTGSTGTTSQSTAAAQEEAKRRAEAQRKQAEAQRKQEEARQRQAEARESRQQEDQRQSLKRASGLSGQTLADAMHEAEEKAEGKRRREEDRLVPGISADEVVAGSGGDDAEYSSVPAGRSNALQDTYAEPDDEYDVVSSGPFGNAYHILPRQVMGDGPEGAMEAILGRGYFAQNPGVAGEFDPENRAGATRNPPLRNAALASVNEQTGEVNEKVGEYERYRQRRGARNPLERIVIGADEFDRYEEDRAREREELDSLSDYIQVPDEYSNDERAARRWALREFGKSRQGDIDRTRETGVRDEDTHYDDEVDLQERHDPLFMRKLAEARDAMVERFMNPWLLDVTGSWVQLKTVGEGKDAITYARLRYPPRVEAWIGRISKLYDCTHYNVMQLVQLRAGLGVDIKGKIAGVDPGDFKLTEDQFVELCKDIERSQREHGHPLGIVRAAPMGVRDDSGNFVVVAKTRCFPLGYMPSQLARDLSKNYDSVLFGTSERDMQRNLAREWRTKTYPAIIANCTGNAMQQAYAIDNMMRALMRIDGADASELVPEVMVNQTLTMMQAERVATGDEDVLSALDNSWARMSNALSRYLHRYRKGNGTRNPDGSIRSGNSRKRSAFEDFLGGWMTMQKAAKCANFMLWLSSPIETAQALMEESVGNMVCDMMSGGISEEYRVTDELEDMATTDQFIEAMQVAESLFRIGGGGWTAIDAFLEATDGSGSRSVNDFTNENLRTWLQEIGVIGTNTVSDRVRQMFGIKPGQEAGFLANVRGVTNAMEDVMLSSGNIMKSASARQFMKRSMAEMGNFSSVGMGSYTADQVAQWGRAGGAQDMFKSLIQTEAGREAFMTMGITSLGRKSPMDHLVRRILSANGVTEFAFRSLIDRFPEYGVQKLMRQVPFSNTISYLMAKGISSMGDLIAAGEQNATGVAGAMQRVADYQVGARYGSFWLGFRKNLVYDSVMAGNKVVVAAIVRYMFMMLGGLHEPPEEQDRWTYSEWIIGDGDHATPMKWAWWTDDIMGVSLPLGVAWTIADQGDWSPEALADATAVFMNGVANFDDGTAIFDVIDIVNNFDEYADDALGANVDAYDPTFDERARAGIMTGIIKMLGDVTPTFMGQIIPWSRDYLLAGDTYARTASKVYDTRNRSMEEAQELNKTTGVDDYVEREVRHATANNWLAGLIMDLFSGAWKEGSDITSYRYGYMPINTRADPFDLSDAMPYMRFYLDTSVDGDLPDDPVRRASALDARAEEVLQYIRDEGYDTPYEAARDGFSLNLEAMQNCYSYCKAKYNELSQELDERKATEGRLPQEEYNSYRQRMSYYYTLYHDWFGYGSEIPVSMVRYLEQNTSYETRYVGENDEPMTYLDYALPQGGARDVVRGLISGVGGLLGFDEAQRAAMAGVVSDDKARQEQYAYGDPQTILPFSRPRTHGKAYNYETPSYYNFMDSNGVAHGDLGAMYDRAQDATVQMGMDQGSSVLELEWGGQGTNMADGNLEEMNLGRGDVFTLGGNRGRNWVLSTDTLPSAYWQDETICKALGLDPSMRNVGTSDSPSGNGSSSTTDPKKVGSLSEAEKLDDPNGAGYYYGGGGGYSGGGGGGGYYYRSYGGGGSSYTPRIYSTTHSVYPSRASGMGVRTPYKPATTYLRPSYSTKGSREAYRRNDL